MRFVIVLTLLLSVFAINLLVNAETIELTDPADIEYAHAVNQTMDGVSAKVMGCIDEGGTREECLCSECSCKFTAEYTAFKKAYNDALAAHPDWDEQVIFFKLDGDPTGYNLNFMALKRQFGGECP